MTEQYPAGAEPSPYGPIATELGLSALAAAEALADKPEWRGTTHRRWLDSDRIAFRATIDCVRNIRAVQMEGVQVAPMDRNALMVQVENFHTSLPFSEAERQSFINGFAQRVGKADYPGRLHQIPVSMIDGGRRRVPPAGELLDAWWAWRRSAFEFEGQDRFYDGAQKSLHWIGQICVPDAVDYL